MLVVVFTGWMLGAAAQAKEKRVLVYTRNGKGYVHDNIPASIAALQQLGQQLGLRVDTSSNPASFTDDNLRQYAALIFSNTNNSVFDNDAQKVAMMRYIQAGGGFMGIHSASGTERNWKWFKLMLGATFRRHPPFQPLRIHVLDRRHPATRGLPASWTTEDECYFFKEFNVNVHVLLVTDIREIRDDQPADSVRQFSNQYPAAWCQEFDGGRVWYTALGHSAEDYSNPQYLAHLRAGLQWLLAKPALNYKRAYATQPEMDEMKWLDR